MSKIISIITLVWISAATWATADVPTADIADSEDSELVGRLQGAFIVSHTDRNFDEATFPLSELKPVAGEKVGNNNRLYQPEDQIVAEGRRTRIVYINRADASPVEVIRTYQRELEPRGGVELYSCEGEACGGDPNRSSGGGGGLMSLAMYLWSSDSVTESRGSNGSCAQKNNIANQRYSLMHVPERKAYVSILAYQLNNSQFSNCRELSGLTVSVLDIVQQEELESTMLTVSSEEMSSEISTNGKIALYGLQFETGMASLKPDSAETLDEIAALLAGTPTIRLLIVGHTDIEGSYEYNLDLSHRRAGSVVEALVAGHGIDRNRLFPVGVSFASPVATNATDDGRAQNRRVELVRF